MIPACLALVLVTASNVAVARDRGSRTRDAEAPTAESVDGWSHFEAFEKTFISEDGRVIDHTSDARSTSEGQAYGLFFALVADDRALFDRMLTWTEDNLAAGDLRQNLPGWLWGKDEDGSWRLLDSNSAADADLWLIYTLLEAGRLWDEPRFVELAGILAARVVQTEVVELPGLGPMLLPGPCGFVLDESTWRLNPSYMPLPVLRRLARAYRDGPWKAMADNTAALLCDATHNGCAPDWIGYRADQGFISDPVTGDRGSYDAIRTYLWAGTLPRMEKHRKGIQECLGGMARHLEDSEMVPESLEHGELRDDARPGPPGFYGALLPIAASQGDHETEARLRAHIETTLADGLYGTPPAYYDQCLLLFAMGNVDGRYRFRANGRLEPGWGRRCTSP